MPTHAERKILRYTPEQMFDLVADVHRYPEFLPWCVGARVLSRNEQMLVADLTIGFKMFRETFRSRVGLERPHHIHVTYETGPFRYLNNHWRFRRVPEGVEIDFYVDFEFRSRILQMAVGVVFNEAVRVMVRAFERRALMLYGRERAEIAQAPASPSTTG
jgi:coenzyme Q-binding protein COQ10